MRNNANLHIAKIKADDEFYTLYEDIEKEIELYFQYDNTVFKNKTILLPCDDPTKSNFTNYFIKNFVRFGIKKLISTSFCGVSKELNLFNNVPGNGKLFILTKNNYHKDLNINNLKYEYLKGNGDFQSQEIIKYKQEADIIITNPPFSLFVNFFDWIVADKKDYLIIGSLIAATNKNVFKYIKNQTMHIGYYTGAMKFLRPDGSYKKVLTSWYTNLKNGKERTLLSLHTIKDNMLYNKIYKKYRFTAYMKYDNYDAIEIPSINLIPSNFYGIMGVPINFLLVYNPKQFEIIGTNSGLYQDDNNIYGRESFLFGKETFKRLFVKNRVNSLLAKQLSLYD